MRWPINTMPGTSNYAIMGGLEVFASGFGRLAEARLQRQSIAELSSATFVDLFAERRGMVFVLGRRDELEPGAEEALVGQLAELRAERDASPSQAWEGQ